jgi:hypothetical protein
MSPDARITWGQQNNFKTPQIIFDEICKAENEFDEVYYANVPENATDEEMAQLGYTVVFSDTYTKYLNSGLISQIKDDYGYSFTLNTLDKLASYVLNESNMCLVGNKIYYYNNINGKLIQKKYNSVNDIEAVTRIESSDQNCDCNVFDLSSDRANTGFYIDNIWTQNGDLNNPTWYYDSAQERFRHYVTMGSSIDNATLHCTFATYAEAGYKKKGKWRRRHKYRPIDYLEGKWDYWYTDANGNNIQNSLGALDNNNNESSGYNDNPNWMKNKRENYLEPTGTFNLKKPIEAIHIVNMKIHGYFIGSTGNYNTNYYQ